MQFFNTPNEAVQVDGKTIHVSRAVAVVMIPIFRLPDKSLHIPVGVRSASTPDHQGKFGLVCGYLDWDESGMQAAVRETWEEIGLDLTAYFWKNEVKDIQPYYVQSNPDDDVRQNVTLRYRLMFDVLELPTLNKSQEVHSAHWISDSSAVLLKPNSIDRFAFNHYHLIVDTFSKAIDLSSQHKHYPSSPCLSV
jgi:8-oxo-dGTP pyrophosphatase MutT (NUDIX family)